MCKVIIADDHRIVIESLEQTFADAQELIEVVGTAETGQEVLDLLRQCQSDIVILDISMPGMTGIETLTAVKQQFPETKVLMLTMHKDADRIKMAMQERANGYLLKNRSGKEVVQAVKTLMEGNYYFPADIQKIVFDSHIPKDFLEDEMKRMRLTDREEEILRLLAAGLNVPDIAKKIHRSTKTVESHKASLMDKIGARNVQDAVRFAVKKGYCPD